MIDFTDAPVDTLISLVLCVPREKSGTSMSVSFGLLNGSITVSLVLSYRNSV